MKARIGCLGILALWALLGITIELSGGRKNSDGGAPMAIFGLLGFALFVVASVLDSLVAWVRRRRQSRGGG
jgi:hypothetical protein